MHETVLLNQAVDALNIRADGIYVDCTFGRGGHSALILSRLNEHGRLLAFDKDQQAIAVAQEKWADDKRFAIVHASFAALEKEITARGWLGRVNGVLMDLGVSSPQLDEAERGFSFMRDGMLDMRMDTTRGSSAAEFIATASEATIADVLYRLGEERFSRRIARFIVEARANEPITRTLQLADIITRGNPKWEKHKHPATRSFLALRLHVNNELGDLESVLPQAVDVLAPMGRLSVISFHSLEDRIVKLFMRREAKGEALPSDLPIRHSDIHTRLKLIGKAIMPGESEVAENARARSAVLRVAEKVERVA